ncbi:hypothetical protein EDB84DRAFT_1579774 [Lactarius hengduanensis]|nr:hypothetical protein EDB84DRAFT_1579774 [Lactarius hengduanensis]
MTVKEQVVYDRVNLTRFVRRLDKSVNEADWWTRWLKSVRRSPLFRNVEPDNEIQPPAKLGKRLADVRRLLDRLDACMLSVNEVALEPERLESFTPTPCLTLTRHLTTEDAAARRPPRPQLRRTWTCSLARPTMSPAPFFRQIGRRPRPARATRWGDAGPASALLQEELAVQLAGQLRRNAEHFSGVLGAGQGVRRAAEERVGANLEVAKQVRVRVHDHRGKALGTTCLTISSVVVVAIASLIMFFVIRFTWGTVGDGRWRREEPVTFSGY